MFNRLILIFVLVLISFGALAEGEKKLKPQLAISPPRIEMFPDEGKAYSSITIINLGNQATKVQVTAENWDFDSQNNYRALKPTPQSLDQWLIINPVNLEVPGNGQQTIRFAIRPRAKPEPGEHRAMIFFQQLSASHDGVNVLFKVGVPVYAFFGDVKREAKVHSLSLDQEKLELNLDMSSLGNAYVRGEGAFMMVESGTDFSREQLLTALNAETAEVTDVKPLAKGKLSSKPVFAGERRTVKVPVVVKETLPASYLLVVKLNIAGDLYENIFTISPN